MHSIDKELSQLIGSTVTVDRNVPAAVLGTETRSMCVIRGVGIEGVGSTYEVAALAFADGAIAAFEAKAQRCREAARRIAMGKTVASAPPSEPPAPEAVQKLEEQAHDNNAPYASAPQDLGVHVIVQPTELYVEKLEAEVKEARERLQKHAFAAAAAAETERLRRERDRQLFALGG
jgi:hypothetical protein